MEAEAVIYVLLLLAAAAAAELVSPLRARLVVRFESDAGKSGLFARNLTAALVDGGDDDDDDDGDEEEEEAEWRCVRIEYGNGYF